MLNYTYQDILHYYLNYMLKVTKLKQILTNTYKTIKYFNSIFYITKSLKLILFIKPKSFKYEYLFKTILVIFKLKKLG